MAFRIVGVKTNYSTKEIVFWVFFWFCFFWKGGCICTCGSPPNYGVAVRHHLLYFWNLDYFLCPFRCFWAWMNLKQWSIYLYFMNLCSYVVRSARSRSYVIEVIVERKRMSADYIWVSVDRVLYNLYRWTDAESVLACLLLLLFFHVVNTNVCLFFIPFFI